MSRPADRVNAVSFARSRYRGRGAASKSPRVSHGVGLEPIGTARDPSVEVVFERCGVGDEANLGRITKTPLVSLVCRAPRRLNASRGFVAKRMPSALLPRRAKHGSCDRRLVHRESTRPP